MPRLSSEGTDVVHKGLFPDDRVLVLGAGGWLGRTALSQLNGVSQSRILALGSHARGISVAGIRWQIRAWNEGLVRDFTPTIVMDFAGISPGANGTLSALAKETNERIAAQFCWSARLPNVRAALTVSSGAAVAAPESDYGMAKRRLEEDAISLQREDRCVTVLRAYSLSGPFVRSPERYAFSSFILGAARGRIEITASERVWRRYVAADDAVRVATLLVLAGHSGVIETGGALVEVGHLAKVIQKAVNPDAEITRPHVKDVDRVYASDDESWISACQGAGVVPEDLSGQVRDAAFGLVGRNWIQSERSS